MDSLSTDRYQDSKDRFLALFQRSEQNMNGHKDHPIHLWRRQAIDKLKDLNFPTRKDEDWKYTSVNKILKQDYSESFDQTLNKDAIAPFLFKDLDAYLLVFVNGVLSSELSHFDDLQEGLSILPLSDALENERFGTLVKTHLEHQVNETANSFVTLNHAFAKHGLFIHIDKNVQVEKPIHLLNLAGSDTQAQLVNPQKLVYAELSSEAHIIDTFDCYSESSEAYFTNVANKIIIKANSNIKHYKIQNEGKDAFQVNNTTVLQDRDSTYTSFSLDIGGKIVRNNLNSILKDSGTLTNFYGLYLADEDQHIDNQTFIDHAFPHCNSNELYKGILAGKARGVFNGKVMVRKDAQKTNAYQQNSSLVLSPTATMDTKPQLEIYADDVKCSHGATIGQLDESSVFYLRSRGLSDEQARAMLQHAFLIEVLENASVETFRDKAERLISIKLKR